MDPLFKPDFIDTLNAFQVPGASVAVLKDDALVFAAGYGVCDLDLNQPVNEHSIFAAGSISKSFTATCLAMLVGEGRLGWDDPVTKHLPGFQLYDAYVTREMTVRDLLTHRSGLVDVSGGTVWYGSDYDRAHVVHKLRHLKPVSSFRSQFAYQNVMYLVAGEIIQAVTGLGWDEFVQQRLLNPLGMTSTNTSTHALAGHPNVAMPHVMIDGKLRQVPYRNYDNVGPAASINTSALDLAQYLRLHLNGGSVDGQTLVDGAALAELTKAQISVPIEPGPEELRARTPKFHAYGMGWFLRDYRGRRLVLHTGGVDGMTAIAAFVPEEQLGVVVLSNQETPFFAAACYHVLDAYFGEPRTDWFAASLPVYQRYQESSRAAQEQVVAARVPGTAPSLALAAYAGRYRDALYGEAAVSLEEDGRLLLRFEHSPCFTGDLQHWHYDTFRIHWRDPMVPPGLLTFPLNAQGKVVEMKFDQPSLLDVDFAELNFVRLAEAV